MCWFHGRLSSSFSSKLTSSTSNTEGYNSRQQLGFLERVGYCSGLLTQPLSFSFSPTSKSVCLKIKKKKKKKKNKNVELKLSKFSNKTSFNFDETIMCSTVPFCQREQVLTGTQQKQRWLTRLDPKESRLYTVYKPALARARGARCAPTCPFVGHNSAPVSKYLSSWQVHYHSPVHSRR